MITLAQILSQFGDAYTQRYDWTPKQAQVAGCIRACRTEQLGGYRLHCDHCGSDTVHYFSCRNRHCPHCQKQASDAWREARRQTLLPVAYYHLVFTLPHCLNGWVRLHPKVIYDVLFQAVWLTLKRFAEDPKRLHGQLGMTAVLHTWGQQLDQHVHLHCLIPAGVWRTHEQHWHAARSNYLFPVRALSRHYRGCMVRALRKAHEAGQLIRITRKSEVDRMLTELMQKDWTVYTKACHGQPERVLDYLARYTHRIAISESRILDIDENQVKFRWKDYRDGKHKVMALAGIEFIRRFLQHVLPNGLMRIRHYGFLANRHRQEKLTQIRQDLERNTDTHLQVCIKNVEERCTTTTSVLTEEAGQTTFYCPNCHARSVKIIDRLLPVRRYA